MADVTTTTTSTPSHERTVLEHVSAVTDYLSAPICCAVIASDAILMAAILRHRRLRDRSNLYLLNFAACHALYIMSTPIFYLILDIFFDGKISGRWHCAWIRVENFGIGLSLSFVACYGLDVAAQSAQPNWFETYRKKSYCAYAALYSLHLLVYFVCAYACVVYEFDSHFALYFLTAYYVSICACVAYAHSRSARTSTVYGSAQPDTPTPSSRSAARPAIKLCAVVLSMWLPLFVWYNFIAFFSENRDAEVILWHTAFASEFCAYSCPLAVVWSLWRGDGFFRAGFRRSLGLKVSDEESEGLDSYENWS